MIEKILEKMSDFNRPQTLGVAALILIAQREQTTVTHQWKEWGYSDIPETLVESIDQLDGDYQFAMPAAGFAIAAKVAVEFAELRSSSNLSLVAEIPTV